MFTRARPMPAGAELDQLVDAHAAAVESGDDDPARRVALQLALLVRFQQSGSSDDFTRFRQLTEATFGALSVDHDLYPTVLMHVAVAERIALQTGDEGARLNEAIAAGEAYLAALPERDRPLDLAHAVADAHMTAWQTWSRLVNLHRGVELRHFVYKGYRKRSPERAEATIDLASAHRTLFDASGEAAALHKAVQYAAEACMLTSLRIPPPPEILAKAALIYITGARHWESRRRKLAREAVRQIRRALPEISPESPSYVDLLNHVTGVLMNAAEMLRRPDLAADAVRTGEIAEQAAGPDHPARADVLTNLGTAKRIRFELTEDPTDAEAAVAALREATVAPGGSAWARLDAAQKWSLFEGGRGRWESAMDAYRTALDALHDLAGPHLSRSDRTVQLARRSWAGLSVDAAACALQLDDPELAVELLERGRLVLHAQDRADAAGAPIAPPTAADLIARWAVDGPAVVVNLSRWRGDALIVSSDGVRVVPLPGLDFEAGLDVVFAFLRAFSEDDFPGDPRTHTSKLLAWCWDVIAEPVLSELGHDRDTGDGPMPRIWWCPTSFLSMVPLHAAGRYGDDGGGNVPDRVVSSYTPALSFLSGPARDEPSTGEPPRLLITAIADEGLRPVETEFLAREFAGRHTALKNEDATRERVLSELEHHSYVYFACHGHQDMEHPVMGGLRLSDGLLTVGRLIGAAKSGEVAFLGACQTAVGGLHNLDEALSLAGALRLAGWQDVVGTLWPAKDLAVAHAAEHVFGALAAEPDVRSPDTVARALHAATVDLRDLLGAEKVDLWAPFVHVGR
ncbi:CHAT domain-containing protein [Actinomadura spongiicola]|uniref:CHAT domain-containing protein n=2 Tax=Actinomadura spongiicola TaxID=2303421 RepID=A0A372GDQ0_9ACTN|nr:CHAT domain-containing protein [Actinomadura spongiicola]